MLRLAYLLAHRCREHLFHREQLARLLTLYDHCVAVTGPVGAVEPVDDGTAALLEVVAARHPQRLTVLRSAVGWPRERDAVVAALTQLRTQLTAEEPRAYLWRLEPWEVWELSAARAAERELDHRHLDAGDFLADYHVGAQLLVRGEWGEGRAAPYRRLWTWGGELCGEDPRRLYGEQRSGLLAPRFDSFAYLDPADPRAGAPAPAGARWESLRERPASDFPLPLAELLGPTGAGLTDTYLHHHDQPQPIPSALR